MNKDLKTDEALSKALKSLIERQETEREIRRLGQNIWRIRKEATKNLRPKLKKQRELLKEKLKTQEQMDQAVMEASKKIKS